MSVAENGDLEIGDHPIILHILWSEQKSNLVLLSMQNKLNTTIKTCHACSFTTFVHHKRCSSIDYDSSYPMTRDPTSQFIYLETCLCSIFDNLYCLQT